MEDNSIYIHEDFYKLIQVLPNNENFDIPESGIVEISDFQKFKNLSIDSKRINFNDIRKIIEKYNPYAHEKVYMGYSTSYKIKENTIAYLFDGVAVFFENDTLCTIENIWLATVAIASEIEAINLFSFFNYIGKVYDLILVDYETDYIVNLDNMEAIKKYFKEKFDLQ
ncbi:hypothetical protein [uncultured Chryseobacterium sp.]|uniref:hypothetical protein n=1 Tax=uncultured Chryseobacterium sp. TaxID=259322 RepID=UPI0025E6C251|nr:hypothetical protein [uncultured Chryseobacterium sp.]